MQVFLNNWQCKLYSTLHQYILFFPKDILKDLLSYIYKALKWWNQIKEKKKITEIKRACYFFSMKRTAIDATWFSWVPHKGIGATFFKSCWWMVEVYRTSHSLSWSPVAHSVHCESLKLSVTAVASMGISLSTAVRSPAWAEKQAHRNGQASLVGQLIPPKPALVQGCWCVSEAQTDSVMGTVPRIL